MTDRRQQEPGTPVSLEAFSRAMDHLQPRHRAPRIAIGVSGGPDSLALTLLTAEWAAQHGGRAVAVTVDHRLRDEAAEEARWVHDILFHFGIEHRTVAWTGSKPAHPRQQHAREARYGLLHQVCAEEGLDTLALAHHREDQAETVLMRAQAQSGPDGLAGMPAKRPSGPVEVVRPLLNFSKADLKATLRHRGLSWVEDPSNNDLSYRRVRIRKAMPELAQKGVTVNRLIDVADHMGKARKHIEAARNDLLESTVTTDPAGYLIVDTQTLRQAASPIRERAIGQMLAVAGGTQRGPRTAKTKNLAERIQKGLDRTMSLNGCLIIPKREELVIAREWEQVRAQHLNPGQQTRFDGRFDVKLSEQAEDGLTLAPIRQDDWTALTRSFPSLKSLNWPGIVKWGLPGLYDEQGQLREVPLLNSIIGQTHSYFETFRFNPRRSLIERPFDPGLPLDQTPSFEKAPSYPSAEVISECRHVLAMRP